MSNGVLIFAYNSPHIDYIKISILAAKLAKKNLSVPVSLVTDQSTLDWAKKSKIYDFIIETFENIIVDECEYVENYRILHDGESKDKVPFRNSSRCRAWELTPYHRTLLIDSDYLIFSKNLSNYWNVEEDFMISNSIQDLFYHDRMQHYDRYISDVGVKLLWATTIMFTKNQYSKVIFDFVDHIRENYHKYSEIYRFDGRIYRNDVSFSLSSHTLAGFFEDSQYFLPPVLSTIDKDILYDVSSEGRLKFLINSTGRYVAASIYATDVHVMNKQSLVRHYDSLMRLT